MKAKKEIMEDQVLVSEDQVPPEEQEIAEPQFQCPYCKRQNFETLSELTEHVSIEHEAEAKKVKMASSQKLEAKIKEELRDQEFRHQHQESVSGEEPSTEVTEQELNPHI